MGKQIKSLLNDALARLILTQIWRIHDLGGVSHGRSLENRLLEASMDLLPDPERGDRDRWTREEVLKEAEERVSRKRLLAIASAVTD